MGLKLRHAGTKETPGRRGRPPKFGRPSELLAMTLPKDVVRWLRSLSSDPAAAVVALYERAVKVGTRTKDALHRPVAELVHLPNGGALIVVQPRVLRNVKGVATIPLADGRAFLALEAARGLADLELAVLDRLQEGPRGTAEERQLRDLHARLTRWRKENAYAFTSRSIILAKPRAAQRRRRSPALA
jgi:hypothetical protein